MSFCLGDSSSDLCGETRIENHLQHTEREEENQEKSEIFFFKN